MFTARRIYGLQASNDETLVLVDGLWPRGIKKDDFILHRWMKEIAPSASLRKWFSHDPGRWDEFRLRYFEELKGKSSLMEELRMLGKGGKVVLLFGAKNEHHNNAMALMEFLEMPA